MRRGQIAIEFSFMIMLAFLFLVVLLVVIAFNIDRVQRERSEVLVQDWTQVLQQELLLAATAHDGYSRTFVLPTELDGNGYTIATVQQSVTLTLDNGVHYTRRIPAITGAFAIGNNRIRRTGESIIIDQP